LWIRRGDGGDDGIFEKKELTERKSLRSRKKEKGRHHHLDLLKNNLRRRRAEALTGGKKGKEDKGTCLFHRKKGSRVWGPKEKKRGDRKKALQQATSVDVGKRREMKI